MKKDTTWKVGKFTVVNYRKPHMEQSKIFYNGDYVASGTYTWINRTWQRYDYEVSLRNAYENMINKMNWYSFEYMRDGIKGIRKILTRMHDYNRSNWSCEL